MLYPRAEIVRSAGAVVFDADYELVLTIVNHGDGNNTISFPKGQLEPEESIEAAARREVEEETGVVCKLLPDSLMGVENRYLSDTKRTKFVYWFVGTAVETREQKLESYEQLSVKWMSIAEARDVLSRESSRQLLDLCLKFLEKQGKR